MLFTGFVWWVCVVGFVCVFVCVVVCVVVCAVVCVFVCVVGCVVGCRGWLSWLVVVFVVSGHKLRM